MPALYARAPENSAIRRYVVALLHWIMVSATLAGSSNILAALQENEELGIEVLEKMRDTNGKTIRDPRLGPDCDFHCHSKLEECPQKKGEVSPDQKKQVDIDSLRLLESYNLTLKERR